MNILSKIIDVFTPVSEDLIKVNEIISSLTISFEIKNFQTFNVKELASIVEYVSENDTFYLKIIIGDNDPVKLSTIEIEEFWNKIVEERKEYEDEKVELNFSINKNKSDYINIYMFDIFQEFWQKTELLTILRLLRDNRNKYNRNDFLLLEECQESFYTESIRFLKEKNDLVIPNSNYYISDNCHFGNREEYPFNPRYFKIQNKIETDSNSIIESLNKLCLLFSIISIFDITTITDNQLYYKLNGYKSYEGRLKISELKSSNSVIYFKIYNWIYSDRSNVDDKIGLVRNIISLSFKENSLDLLESVYISIQAGYKVYLRENITKYIEIRNKMVDELEWVSQKSSEIVSEFLKNYKNSIFTFLSFFISVFLLRFLKGGDVTKVFSMEVTLFSLTFLILSFVFMFFSIWVLKGEKTRLERKYDNLKNRYSDLLNEDEIKRVLKDDDEFKYELEFIQSQKKKYIGLWVVTILILLCAVLSVSNYINWETIISLINRIMG